MGRSIEGSLNDQPHRSENSREDPNLRLRQPNATSLAIMICGIGAIYGSTLDFGLAAKQINTLI